MSIWGKKLSHGAKSKKNLANTLEITFLKQSSLFLSKNVCLDDFWVRFKSGLLGVRN